MFYQYEAGLRIQCSVEGTLQITKVQNVGDERELRRPT